MLLNKTKLQTIFYLIANDKNNIDFVYEQKNYVEWFTLENILYQPDNKFNFRITLDDNTRRILHTFNVTDIISNNQIIRKILIPFVDVKNIEVILLEQTL